MAQTWRITRGKVATFRMIDALLWPAGKLLSLRRSKAASISNVLVLEPWYIGDVVLATPILRAIRRQYPEARLTLLGAAHAEELLRHSGLADEVMIADLPWTAKSAKYDPRRYDWRVMRDLIAKLRHRRFDLTIDARMDLRSNLMTFLTGAPRRVGYDFGGGAFLLTDAVAADPDRRHRVDDWLELMRPLEAHAGSISTSGSEGLEPYLAVSEAERDEAAARLREAGINPGEPVIAVHGGAGDARRRWPRPSFEKVAERLAADHGARVIWFLEPEADETAIPVATAAFRTSLREMMALLTHCNLFLCNDSGPMHIADALGVPVVAVFLTGNPVWHRPYRKNQLVVGAGTGHDFLVAPAEAEVLAAAVRRLSESMQEAG
ncbi:MAG: glycosyltransferase family 9 protein [Gemmatimonadaceae bacterium]